ncbi:ribokinase [Exiguobacterium sp. UBA5002]|uniref:ribokinase n=1 Tax=Exiguobacterium sp. UBA5002 TaxID=1946497 RepID=UPI0025BF7435|nr:ribokinase [Exiguobacterium sp. UBA5002]
MKQISVIGSISMDLVVESKRRPGAGETVIGDAFHTVPGGKGANQAVAVARLGSTVEMIGCVGGDANGEAIRENFKTQGVQTTHLQTIEGERTGTAHITLAEGDNSIVVVQSANQHVQFADNALTEILAASEIILLQLEIPIETVETVAREAHATSIPVVLNPAPAMSLSPELIEHVTYLTPNEHECGLIFGQDQPIEHWLMEYPNKLIVTEGSLGARFYDGEAIVTIPAIETTVVDTTGAGDTFNGALAVALTEGQPLVEAIRFANRAAGLSIRALGAQGGMPTREQMEGDA